MAWDHHHESLKTDLLGRIKQTVDRFLQDCDVSFPRNIADYLPGEDDPLRGPLLRELIRVDLFQRFRRDRPTAVEQYIHLFPEISDDSSLPSLICQEYRIRRQTGDDPDLHEYEARFPQHYAQLVNSMNASELPIDSESLATKTSTTVNPDSSGPKEKDPDAGLSGQYRLIRKIGEGGFGEVWEALGPGGVPVAIKRVFGAVSPRAIEREKGSLDLFCSGKLRHPFLLQVFGWWLEEDQLHIAMELADLSLLDKLKAAQAQGRIGLTPAELQQVMWDAAAALDFLNHEENILHRDVKPANMLLMANRLKLCDFGLSRMSENLAIAMGRTLGAGTPVFIAPEVIEGFQSKHSDQYSLAISYYVLRTGQPVFRGKAAEIRKQHLFKIPELDAKVLSEAEITALLRAMRKLPDERFPSCTAFIEQLFTERPGPQNHKPKRPIYKHTSTLDQDAFGTSALKDSPSGPKPARTEISISSDTASYIPPSPAGESRQRPPKTPVPKGAEPGRTRSQETLGAFDPHEDHASKEVSKGSKPQARSAAPPVSHEAHSKSEGMPGAGGWTGLGAASLLAQSGNAPLPAGGSLAHPKPMARPSPANASPPPGNSRPSETQFESARSKTRFGDEPAPLDPNSNTAETGHWGTPLVAERSEVPPLARRPEVPARGPAGDGVDARQSESLRTRDRQDNAAPKSFRWGGTAQKAPAPTPKPSSAPGRSQRSSEAANTPAATPKSSSRWEPLRRPQSGPIQNHQSPGPAAMRGLVARLGELIPGWSWAILILALAIAVAAAISIPRMLG